MDDTQLFDATDEATFTEEEFADASKPMEIFPEGDYPVEINSAGNEDDTAVVKPNSIQVELVLTATNPEGHTTQVWHNQTLYVKAADSKKAKRVKGMAARFYAAFGFSASEAQAIHRALLARESGAASLLVGRTTRAHITVGKNNKGRDRNEIGRFYVPNGAGA
jgi:hypothetical protein